MLSGGRERKMWPKKVKHLFESKFFAECFFHYVHSSVYNDNNDRILMSFYIHNAALCNSEH